MFIIVAFSPEFLFNLFKQYGFPATSYTCEYLDEIRIIKRPYFFKVSFSLYIHIRCSLSRVICKYCATNPKFFKICGTYLSFLYSEILMPIRLNSFASRGLPLFHLICFSIIAYMTHHIFWHPGNSNHVTWSIVIAIIAISFTSLEFSPIFLIVSIPVFLQFRFELFYHEQHKCKKIA